MFRSTYTLFLRVNINLDLCSLSPLVIGSEEQLIVLHIIEWEYHRSCLQFEQIQQFWDQNCWAYL
jgi:hypothetical protein